MNLSVLYALAAAALFGASTPLAKLLGLNIPPVLLAGLLYLGSGLGLTIVRLRVTTVGNRSALYRLNGLGFSAQSRSVEYSGL